MIPQDRFGMASCIGVKVIFQTAITGSDVLVFIPLSNKFRNMIHINLLMPLLKDEVETEAHCVTYNVQSGLRFFPGAPISQVNDYGIEL